VPANVQTPSLEVVRLIEGKSVSNEECYRRIVMESNVSPTITPLELDEDHIKRLIDRDARALFQRPKAHSEEHNLLEANFVGQLRSSFHSSFWELYLPAALERYGIRLERGQAPEPDFRFQHGGVTVFIEAVACGEPAPQNEVPLQEGGWAPEGRIIQRLAQSIDSKIERVTRPEAEALMNHHGSHWVVIAVNGHRAINDWPHEAPGVPFLPFVVRALFGAAEDHIDQNGNMFWVQKDRITKDGKKSEASFPIGHFNQPKWLVRREADMRGIAGVLYSAVSVLDTAWELGDDFLFVQNPNGPDVTGLFSFCKRGVWDRKEISPGRYRLQLVKSPPAVGDAAKT
jgi:hypothetical protein